MQMLRLVILLSNVAGTQALDGKQISSRPMKLPEWKQKEILWISGNSVHPRCTETQHYLDQYEIALISWNQTKNTKVFHPVLILHIAEGAKEADLDTEIQNKLQLLRRRGATVIFHRLSFIQRLTKTLQASQDPELAGADAECFAGTYMRLEIPKVLEEQKISGVQRRHNQRYILYSDMDVIWWRQVKLNEFMSSVPTKFAVAYSGQFCEDELPTNTGVILMNVDVYKHDMPKLLKFMFKDNELTASHDQGIFNAFYSQHGGRVKWDAKWNYRMYWNGLKKPVALIHYWAVKPTEELDCWIKERSWDRCPKIEDGGLIPKSSVEGIEERALKFATSQDKSLAFMKKVMLRYQKYMDLQEENI